MWENVNMRHDFGFHPSLLFYYFLSIRCSAQVHSPNCTVAGYKHSGEFRGLKSASEAFLDTGKIVEDPAYGPNAHR